jgi:hypothetical protein
MTSDEPEANRIESLALCLIFAAVSVALLASLGLATRTGADSGGWWTRPALAPGVALGLLAAANLISLFTAITDLRRNPPGAAERAAALIQFAGWLRPVEYLAYFAAYLWAIQHIGYIPASVVFVIGLIFRAGLRGWGWVVAGLGLVLFLLLVFRMALGVWMPAPDLYDLAPEVLRTILFRWF